jgi:hypothetical protein
VLYLVEFEHVLYALLLQALLVRHLHQPLHSLRELSALHTHVFIIDLVRQEDSSLNGNCFSSSDVVSSDHANSNTCFVAHLNGANNFWSKGIFESENGNSCEINLENFSVVLILEVSVLSL